MLPIFSYANLVQGSATSGLRSHWIWPAEPQGFSFALVAGGFVPISIGMSNEELHQGQVLVGLWLCLYQGQAENSYASITDVGREKCHQGKTAGSERGTTSDPSQVRSAIHSKKLPVSGLSTCMRSEKHGLSSFLREREVKPTSLIV